MKKILVILLIMGIDLINAQTYLISSGGTVNTCSGTFYDSGGPGGSTSTSGVAGNYSNNEDFTITFCPGTPGQVIQINFTAFRTENWNATYDRLFMYNGPSTASPFITSVAGNPGVFSVFSTDPSGCLTFRFRSDGSTNRLGWEGVISCVPPALFHSNTSTTTCSARYFDNGGLNNYSNNVNSLQTICPSSPTEYVSLNFTEFNLENNYDYMIIHNGNSPNADIIGVYTGTTSPGTITSSVPGGCLSIRFFSDNSTTRPGWLATVSCSATPGPPPTPSAQDCGGGMTICSNSSFTANSGGLGANELPVGVYGVWPFLYEQSVPWAGCLSAGERQSSWYYFSPATSGTIGFTINPTVATDYDFAIWGPYTEVSCPSFTGDTPLRCSFATGVGATGLGNGATDFSEGQTGNGWVAPISVVAGQVYVMVISNFTASSNPFTMNWNLTDGATLDCTPLPIDLLSFTGENIDNENILNWVTASEINNSHFRIEHSFDVKNWELLSTISGNNSPSMYEYIHSNPRGVVNYYRLIQVDFNGDEYNKGVISVNNTKKDSEIIGIYNILGQIVTMEHAGLKIIHYSDGTIKKVY